MMDQRTWIDQLADVFSALSDRSFQERVWLRGEGPEVSSFDEEVCGLQDKDLDGFIERCSDWNLDPSLASELRSYDVALMEIVRDVGPNARPETVLDDPRWPALREAARRIVERLEEARRRVVD